MSRPGWQLRDAALSYLLLKKSWLAWRLLGWLGGLM